MIVPYSPEQPPSPRVQELGQRIALTIAEYQQRNPDLSAEEVRAAAQLATSRIDAPRASPIGVVAAAVGAVFAAGLGAWLYTARPGSHPPVLMIGAIVVGVAAVLAVVKHRT